MRPKSDKGDTPVEVRRVQCAIYRRMSAREKLDLVFGTYRTGRQLALAGIRMRNPDASEADLWQIWAREHLGEELFDSVYGGNASE